MKKWILHILLFASLFGMLATSCSQDEVVEQSGTTNGTVRIQFTLDMDGTRAADETWGTTINTSDNRVIGNDYENKIDLGRLQVFLFDTYGRYMGEVGGLTINPSNSSSNTYTFTGEVTVKGVDVTIVDGVKKLVGYTIMVTANYEGYINGNLAVTQNYIFDYIAANYHPNANGVANSYIPMWGMLKTDIPLHEDRATATTAAASNPVNIYMLRSLAKIEVNMLANGFNLTGAKLNKHNNKGYILPNKNQGTKNSYFTYNSTSEFLTSSSANPYTSTDGELPLYSETADKKYVIYVPEYANTGGDLEIQLTITDASSGNKLQKEGGYKIIHGNYSEGKPVDDGTTPVVRNHYYQYNINKVENGVDAEITLTVTPWSVNQSTVDYLNEVSVEQIISWSTGVTPTENNGIVLSDNLREVNFSFTLTTPRGGTWYAELVKVSGADGAFQFKDANNNLSQGIDGTIDGNSRTLTIVATQAEADVTENNEFLLKIYVETPALEGTTPRRTDVTNLLGAYTIVQSKQMNN